MGVAVGIDLGTTFSVVSYLKNGTDPIVIPNDYGNRTTPSVVCFDLENNTFVGESALELSQSFPQQNTIKIVKRNIGTNHRYKINDKQYSPEEISSEILKYLKQSAERYIGETVDKAVVTVPAYFNNDQRQSTKIACELAGLEVLRIINEPTAASLAYGLDNKKDATILVFDLGGGTFDVTILKLTDGIDFHVLSTSGNTKLGGVDFDEKLSDLIFEKFKDNYLKNNGEDFNHVLNEHEKNKLLVACEKTKKLLSLGNKGIVNVPYFVFKGGKSFDLQIVVDRNEFEQSIEPIISILKSNIDNALEDANLLYCDLDEVVFVGGSTRIPLVAKKVKDWTGKTPNQTINPDEAVSIGAAIQASVLTGSTNKEVFLVDVIPLTLGIETQGGFMTTMIRRNTSIPAQYEETFTTAFDNQTSVDVKVFQGERPQTKNNHYLGEFKLENIEELPRGVPKINVLFSVDSNGILTVSAKDENNQKTLVLTGSSSLTADEMKKLINDAEENKISDQRYLEIMNCRNLLYDYEIQIQEMINTNTLNSQQLVELVDLKKSIEFDVKSENIELLSGLVHSCKQTISEYSELLYKKAKQLINE